MISFEMPIFLLFLLLLPLAYVLKKRGVFGTAFFLTLSDWGGKPDTWHSSFFIILRKISILFFLVSFVALVIALANPTRVYEEKVFTKHGQDIFFLLDVSPSMSAHYESSTEKNTTKFQATSSTTHSTRLDSAKNVITKFVENRSGDSVGLGILGSTTALVVPTTTTYSVFHERLSLVRIGEMGEETALGTGLTMATTHIKSLSNAKPASSENQAKSVLILLTDGENNAGKIHPETAAEFVRQSNIRFYIIGVGSAGEVTAEYFDPTTGNRVSGVFESSFNDYSLQKLALYGGGKYARAENSEELMQVLSEISEENPTTAAYYTRTVTQSFADVALLICLFGFCIAWFLRRVFLGNLL